MPVPIFTVEGERDCEGNLKVSVTTTTTTTTTSLFLSHFAWVNTLAKNKKTKYM